METLDRITKDTFAKYGNRKKPGRISLFIDVENNKAYPVPIDTEHIDYAAQLKRKERVKYEKLIPTHIDTNGSEVTGVSTGYSGLEMKMNIRHSYEDLEEAHKKTWELIKNGNLPIGKIQEDSISEKYAKKARPR